MLSPIASTHIIPKGFTGIFPCNQSCYTERKLFNVKSIKKLLSNYIYIATSALIPIDSSHAMVSFP